MAVVLRLVAGLGDGDGGAIGGVAAWQLWQRGSCGADREAWVVRHGDKGGGEADWVGRWIDAGGDGAIVLLLAHPRRQQLPHRVAAERTDSARGAGTMPGGECCASAAAAAALRGGREIHVVIPPARCTSVEVSLR